MTALLVFFANLTVRMRLDRLDGVGEVVWVNEYCVEATLSGFLDALKAKAELGQCRSTLPEEFFQTVRAMTPGQLGHLFGLVVGAYDQDAPDLPVIRENLAAHVFSVYRAFHKAMS